jgi:hypothetical protein
MGETRHWMEEVEVCKRLDGANRIRRTGAPCAPAGPPERDLRSSLAYSSCPPLGLEDHCRPLTAAHPPRLDDASPILRRNPDFTSDQGIVSLRSIDIVRFASHCGGFGLLAI